MSLANDTLELIARCGNVTETEDGFRVSLPTADGEPSTRMHFLPRQIVTQLIERYLLEAIDTNTYALTDAGERLAGRVAKQIERNL